MKKFLALSLSDVVFIMLKNVKMPKIVDIYEQDKFRAHLSWAWKKIITRGPDCSYLFAFFKQFIIEVKRV